MTVAAKSLTASQNQNRTVWIEPITLSIGDYEVYPESHSSGRDFEKALDLTPVIAMRCHSTLNGEQTVK